MKTKLLKLFSLRATMLTAMLCAAFTGAWADTETITLWSEDFSSYSASAVPEGGTYSYVCVNGGSDTKIYNEKLAGGTAPELLVGRKNNSNSTVGSFQATISDFQGCTGKLTLSYKRNNNSLTITAKSNTSTGIGTAAATVSTATVSSGTYTHEITLPTNATNVIITFTAGSTNNVRLDDIVLTGEKEVASNAVATTVTIDATSITNTDIADGTAAGSLSASVTYGSPSANVPEATVAWSSSSEDVATVADNGTVTLVGVGTTTITASYAGVADTYQSSSATYELTVTNSNANDGSQSKPYTVAEALAATPGDNDVYVRGIICSIASTSVTSNGQIRYYISDDGTDNGDRLNVYNGKGIDGAAFTSIDDIQVEDVVVIKGKLSLYQGANQLNQNNQLVSLIRKVDIATINGITPTTVNWNTTDEFTLDVTNADGVTASDYDITWTSSDPAKLELADEIYESKSVEAEVTVTVTITPKGDKANTHKEVSRNFTVNIVDSRVVVNMTGFTASATTLNVGGTATTTVTNDQAGWTAAYTYTSSAEDVATVESDGTITAVAAGSATITAALNVSDSDPVYKAGTTTSKTINITVTEATISTVTFSVNGATSSEAVAEGSAVPFPAVENIGGKSFVGWTKSTISGSQDSEPNDLVTSTTMGDADVTYFAVFGDVDESTTWQKITNLSTVGEGVYALISSDGHAFNGSISSGHGQSTSTAFSFDGNGIATSSPEGVCELTLTAVTGGYTMYNPAKGYLYATKAASGGLAWHETESGYWSYKVLSEDNWVYSANEARLRVYSNTFRTYGANSNQALLMAKKTTIKNGSGYCTSISESVTVTSAGFATYCSDKALDFSASDIKAYLGSISGSTLTFAPVTTIPANTGMLLVKDGGATETIPAIAEATGTSCLTGVLTETTINSDDYILNMKDGKPGFYPAGTYTTLGANKAYITKETAGLVKGFAINFDGDETVVKAVKVLNGNAAIYNLAGQRVNSALKGVFIQNGKKFIVK